MLEHNSINESSTVTNKNLKTNKSCNNLFHKDYDYPSLNRKDLMSLSTINSKDFPHFPPKRFKQLSTNRDWSLNLYNLDIEGSSPRKFGIFSNKIDYTNKNDDIERSFPLSPRKVNKPNFNLSNEDIEASRPSKCKLVRHTNPLQPQYSLPKCEEIPINDKTKFIRDPLYIGDIKTRIKRRDYFLRDTLNKDDLKETFPKKLFCKRKDNYNNLDYSDISKKNDKNKRNINPLMPIYTWKYPVNNMRYNVGPIDGNISNPFSLYKYINPFNLRNDDIEGSNPGSKNVYKRFKGSNSCLNIGDITGAIHGSLTRGIITKRVVNPVAPEYIYPGEIELKTIIHSNNINNSLNDSNNKNENNNNENNKNLKNDIIIKNIKVKKDTIDLINSAKNFKISKNNNFNLINKIFKKRDDEKVNNENKILNEEKNQSEDDAQINQLLSKIDDYATIDNEIKFDRNAYKKPDIYYPLVHDKRLNPQIKDYNKNFMNRKLRSYQQVINEKIKFANCINNPSMTRTSIISKNPKTYENKMDDFFINSTINNYKLQQKIKKNINAYYDIGFPEELKAGDIEPKF